MSKKDSLTPKEIEVLFNKATEAPFSGEYWNHKGDGSYVCKYCGAPLYDSSDKFDSNCGWPSFESEIEDAIIRQADPDGRRTEIICAKCKIHLGHVFNGEMLTEKNVRHCVNSLSLNFIPKEKDENEEKIYLGGGCFWGMEYYLKKEEGVISSSVGFIGGHTENPTYKEVCTGSTGHAEVVEVVYDKTKTNITNLIKLYFEIHDCTQINRQGPDIGEQYRSEIFYTTEEQKEISQDIINILISKGYEVATEITTATQYYQAENYHQDYFENKGKKPTCHSRNKIF